MPITVANLPVSITGILGILGEIELTTQSPWAVLRIQFSDQTASDWPLTSKYEDLFTSAGSGKMGLVDYYSDMSHGQLDLSGSKVFGPFKIPYKRADYVGRFHPNAQPGQLTDTDMLALAKSTATSAGVNLNSYAGVCLTFIGQVDLFGDIGTQMVFCDTGSLDVCGLAHEFGHGYGLDHSRIYGSNADYQDPWDLMSAYNVDSADSQEFTKAGPGLNAWNMRSRTWLDETRVWSSTSASFDDVVELRPLHRRDLPGYLAAQVGQYLVEFRVPQRWDAAIPRACVLVHSFLNNHSYLMYSHSGSSDIIEGDKFVFGDPNNLVFGYYAAEVIKIDVPNLTATVRLHQRPRQPVRVPQTPVNGQLLPGVVSDRGGVDGSGGIMLDGEVIPLPPNGPERELVQGVARYLNISVSSNNVASAMAARRAEVEGIVRTLVGLYKDALSSDEPPPGYPASGNVN